MKYHGKIHGLPPPDPSFLLLFVFLGTAVVICLIVHFLA